MKISQIYSKFIKENNLPTPDEAGNRVKDLLAKHKGKPGAGPTRGNNHERNTWHADQDKSEQQQRDDKATANNISEMAWINRSAPAVNVSYDKVLDTTTDTWKGDKVKVTEISQGKEKEWVAAANKWRTYQTAKGGGSDPKIVAKADNRAERTMKIQNKHAETINELSVDTLKKYTKDVEKMDPATTPKFKMVKHDEGHAKAKRRIAHMTGDRNSKMYEAKLAEIMEAFDANAFADILGKQEKEKEKPAANKKSSYDVDFLGWVIRILPPSMKNGVVKWGILEKKSVEKNEAKFLTTGQSTTEKDAIADAEAWLKKRGSDSAQSTSTSNATIDFNTEFSEHIIGGPDKFYAAIDYGDDCPVLYISTIPQKMLKPSHLGRSKEDNNTQLQTISLTPPEVAAAKLVRGGRYKLGNQLDGWGKDMQVYELILHSETQGSRDKQRLHAPGLTVARPTARQ